MAKWVGMTIAPFAYLITFGIVAVGILYLLHLLDLDRDRDGDTH